MLVLATVLVIVTLVLCGAYAGLVLMCQIGVLPAMQTLSPQAFADAWRAMDARMERSMPPYKVTLLIVNLATAIVLLFLHQRALAVCAAISFLLSLAGLILTIRGQVPLNRELKELTAAATDDRLSRILSQTIRNFSERFVLAAAAFVSLAVGVVLWPVQ